MSFWTSRLEQLARQNYVDKYDGMIIWGRKDVSKIYTYRDFILRLSSLHTIEETTRLFYALGPKADKP